MDYTDEEIQRQLQEREQQKGTTYSDSDLQDVRRRDNSQSALDMAFGKIDARASNAPNQDEHFNGAENKNATPAQAWNAAPQTQGRSDDLYNQLKMRIDRANGPVDPNDPIIKGQADTFRAEQTRGSRDYLSNIAEQAGPYANLRGEQRIAAEKVGQNNAGFLAQLLAREQDARRQEAGQALGIYSGQVTGDQNRELQSALGFGDLNLRGELGRGQLALGQGQLALGNRGLDTSNDQFLRELALRQWQAGDNSDFMWAGL